MEEDLNQQREKKILSFIENKDYRPMKAKEMAVLFSVPKEERGIFRDTLDALVRRGKIEIDGKGRIRLPEDSLIAGTFLATKKGYGFVRSERGDIFIPEPYCKNAFHGDWVQVRLSPRSWRGNHRMEGQIVYVLERKTTTVVGVFTSNHNISFVVPDYDKYTKDIYIPKGKTGGALDGHKVVAEITDYGQTDKNPEGQVVQILGHIDDPGVDILSVIASFGISEEFPEEVERSLNDIPDHVDPSEAIGRLDLRLRDTVTIDGEDAKDLDDAVTIEKKEDGTFELGVHIADVSHYVRENSPLDREALERGTSVYLVDRVVPMLPRKISNGIGSLNAGVDRLALSCIMTFDAKGKMTDHRIEESILCVTERMNYTDVRDILEYHKPETCRRYEKLVPMFETMGELALILRKNRKRQGSIDFDFPECKIKLDGEGHSLEIVPYERNVATEIIEEFMLAANKAVAEEYAWLELPFIYRTHDIPDLEKIRGLARLAAGFGYHMKVGTKVHPKEIQKLIEQIEGTEEESFLSRLTLRSMKRARYSTEKDGHFGLATSYYCHFTSPIRRYPDLQIHRIIKENIRQGITGKRFRHYESILPSVAESSSDRERRADEAEREVLKIKKAEYMMDHIGEIFPGIISGVTSWGIYVELPNTVEGMVRLADMEDDQYEFEEERYRVLGHYTGREFRMGQKVQVQVTRVDKLTRTIDLMFIMEEI